MITESDRELIHKVLDGDAATEEKERFSERLAAEQSFKKEFEALARAVRIIAAGERPAAPPLFTAGVMKKLPRRQASLSESLQTFLFKGNGIRWGISAAATAVVLALVALALIGRLRTGPGQIPAVSSFSPQVRVVTVEMRLYAPEAHRVAVAGSFNKWDADDYAMTKQDNGTWTINLPLKPGVYTYMFIVDNSAWVTDPNAGSYRDDGFGYKNAVKRVMT